MKRKIISVILIFLFIPVVSFADGSAKTYVNETFEGYDVGAVPTEISVTSPTYYIGELEKGGKALVMLAGKKKTELTFDTYSPTNICISFDIMRTENIVTGGLAVIGSGGKSQDILAFTNESLITSPNGYRLGGVGNQLFNNVSVEYNGSASCMDVYVNGRCAVDDFKLTGDAIEDIAKISFSFVSETEGSEIILDNVYAGTSLKKSGVKIAKLIKQDTSAFESEFGKRVGSDVYLKGDFEKIIPGMAAHKGNVIEQYKEGDNTVALFRRINESDFHLDIKDINSGYDSVVYEWKLKLQKAESQVIIYLQDNESKISNIAKLTPGGKLSLGNGYESKLKENEWIHIAAVYNYYDRTRDIYFNGERVVSSESIGDSFMRCGELDCWRFHVYNSTAGSDIVEFLIDDVFVYDSEVPLSKLDDFKRVLNTESQKTVFYSDNPYVKLLDGKISFHKRSGVVYANGKKHTLNTKPYEKDGLVYIVAEEMDAVTGMKSTLSGSVTLQDYSKSVNKILSQDKVTVINDGMYVISNSSFSFPEDETVLGRLNDFAFYFRPDSADIDARYNASPLAGVHPRIQASTDDFTRVREAAKINPYVKAWSDTIIKRADTMLKTSPVKYELRDGIRLLYVSRDVLENMYTLGMAYQLTGDTRYAERAYKDLYVVCGDFPDWHPTHAIDTAEMAAAVAIGYDWMYHAFTPEQRAVIEDGMYQNGFYYIGNTYQTKKSSMGSTAVDETNFGTVVNFSAIMAALAMYDVYPKESNYIICNAMRSHEFYLHYFAPEGLWYEGPNYWEYTTQYLIKGLSTLDKFFGTDFSLSSMEGLSTTADYILHTQSSMGVYAYGDSPILEKIYTPEMFWMSNKYENSSLTRIVYESTNGKFITGEDYALALLWCDTSLIDSQSNKELPLEKFYEHSSTLVARNSWVDEISYFGAHAGYSVEGHSQLDVGSFIFDLNGVRWATDPGVGDYNAPRDAYWDATENGLKWQLFKCRAESHNTIVVNPDKRADHIPLKTAYGKMRLVQAKPRGIIASVDMTPVLRDVNSAKRGFFFTDNRQSLVVRDEVSLQKEGDVYWFLMTYADAEINGNRITLSQNGRKLDVDYVTNGNAEVSFGPAVPLPTSPMFEGDKYPSKCNRLIIKVHGSGNVNITVKLSGEDMSLSDVEDYDMPISQWNVPDGEVPTPPSINNVTILDKEYDISSGDLEYCYIDGELDSVPNMTVQSDVYDISVIKGASLDESTKIYVKDKNDPQNMKVYTVVFKKMPKPVSFDGMETYPVHGVTVSDEPQPANAAIMAVDGDLGTRWSADGNGHYIILDLGEEKLVDTVYMAFYSGDTRSTRLAINLSSDGEVFDGVWEGLSSGKTSDYEKFSFEQKKARYIKIDCNGNTSVSVGGWNSITEIVVAGKK